VRNARLRLKQEIDASDSLRFDRTANAKALHKEIPTALRVEISMRIFPDGKSLRRERVLSQRQSKALPYID
jgi:hypothetical protein